MATALRGLVERPFDALKRRWPRTASRESDIIPGTSGDADRGLLSNDP
jgi:hypothetical protein